MLIACEIVSHILFLRVDKDIKGSEVDSHQCEYCLIVDNAPLFVLDNTYLFEDLVHSLTVCSIVELVKIKIIKYSKKVEQGREDASAGRDRNGNLKYFSYLL